MKGTFKPEWLKQYTLAEAANAILTGRDLDAYITARPLLLDRQDLPFDEKLRVLDFGCGMGRCLMNGGQTRPYWEFIGYDNRVMLDRIPQIWPNQLPNVTYTDDWNAIKTGGLRGGIDIVYAELVLQHLQIEHLHQYLADFNTFLRASANEHASLIVHGRRTLDDGRTNLWPIVLEYFDDLASAAVPPERLLEGNPHDHFMVRFVPKDL
jgi:hypothetical protein